MKIGGNRYLWNELREFRPAFAGLLIFSLIITLMYLIPSIFMEQVYERVMQSRSYETLSVLFVLVFLLCIIWAALETVRSKVLQRISFALDEKISARLFDALNRQRDSLPAATRAIILQDLTILRDFLTGTLIIQALDFIWVPMIILAAFLFHPVLGAAVLAMTVVVGGLAYFSQVSAKADVKNSFLASAQATEFGRSVMQTAETTRVMGMLPALVQRWRQRQRDAIGWQQTAGARASVFVNMLKFLRHMYVPIMLTVGTLLYLDQQVGAGAIFAASILVGRAVAPVDMIANSWKSFWNVAASAGRINEMLGETARYSRKIALPVPDGPLVLSRVAASPQNKDFMILSDISFAVEPGRVVGVVGSSGAGKSSLGRVLVGAWRIARGSISLDGHELSHWDQDQLGLLVGYVPQDIELLPGTVAENIARFATLDADTEQKVIDAVRLAGVQDIVGKLPDGLNTRLGPDGHTLSGGQRQRIALARAVYGTPKLVVLDEPNSNLDAAGEQQLALAITKLRNDGSIVVLITHRMNMLTICDSVLVLNAGTVHAFGPRDQLLDRLSAYKPKEIAGRVAVKVPTPQSVAA